MQPSSYWNCGSRYFVLSAALFKVMRAKRPAATSGLDVYTISDGNSSARVEANGLVQTVAMKSP